MGAFAGALYGGYCRVAKELGATHSPQELEAIRGNLSFVSQQAKQKNSNEVSTSQPACR